MPNKSHVDKSHCSTKLKDWQRYQDTAATILNEVADHFGFSRVEGKQSVPGLRSGTDWEIDAKGVSVDGEAFVIIESRRYITSKLKQEHVAGLAYRMIDTGAAGGVTVTPLGLQKGAEKVAHAEKIVSVRLNADATPEQFVLEFLGNLLVRPPGTQGRGEIGQVRVSVSSTAPLTKSP